TPNTNYSVTVKVYDNANNVNDKANAVPITTKGQLLPPRITPSTLNQYYTSDITISIQDTAESTKTRASKIKYKRTSSAGEETINGTSGNFKITTDGTYQIYACTEDAQGNKSTWVNTNSFILDKINPSISITAGTGTTNSIPVTITASDTNGITNYKYEYKENGTSEWKTATFSNNSYTGLSDGKTYDLKVTVTDGAGRTNSAQTTGTTKVANTPPYNLTTNCSSKTTTSMTIRARAYDNDSPAQTLTYTLSLNGQTRTATGTSGNYVTFSAVSGLSEYTYYNWTVTVKDSNNASISGTGRDRTYCSGTTYSCNERAGPLSVQVAIGWGIQDVFGGKITGMTSSVHHNLGQGTCSFCGKTWANEEGARFVMDNGKGWKRRYN
ncbi:MAG: fibronectin type III domain-containing protein, partial [Clostridia bacterium]|nr:fibronectin type III domain-containing protein [Clostridia bacterium]